MNPLVFDASLLAGTAMLGIGSGVQFGAGVGLMVTGASVVALTVISAYLARGR